MLINFVCTPKELKSIKTSELKNYVGKKLNTIWINVYNAENEEVAILKEIFKIHPTTIEDIFSQQTPIKHEDFDDYKVIIFKGVKDLKKRTISSYNIAFIFGENFVITVGANRDGTINDLLKNEKRIESLLKQGRKHLVHYIIDKEVDEYVKIQNELNEELGKLEIQFLQSQNKETLAKIYAKELTYIELRQITESIVDLCLALTKSSEHQEDKNLIPYFKDVYDHALKTMKSYQSMMERMNGMQERYATMTSMRTNEVMRSLTIIMALMMPLTVITGFYGMNIKLPFSDNPLVWVYLLVAMILSAIGMIAISMRRGWIEKKD